MNAPAATARTERIAALLQRELADIFLRKVKDPRLKACVISQVRLSNDLRVAWVGLSAYGADEASIRKALQKAAGFIRREVSSRLELRHSPELRFEIDHGAEILMDMTRKIRALRDDSTDENDDTDED
jgi:ribosome-binding factor A